MRKFQALGKKTFTTAPNTILNIDHINNANKQDKTIVQSTIILSSGSFVCDHEAIHE